MALRNDCTCPVDEHKVFLTLVVVSNFNKGTLATWKTRYRTPGDEPIILTVLMLHTSPYFTIIGPTGLTNPTHTFNYTSPLDIPEIIAQVGYFLTLWYERRGIDGGYKLYFEPDDLQSCLLVSKTWYNAILPVLWRVYDGRVMCDIPNDIITRHIHLFRHVYHNIDHPGAFKCARLLTLELSIGLSPSGTSTAVHSQIIQNNPNLKKLAWDGRAYNLPLLEADAFMGLSRLQNLSLYGWDVPNRRLFGALMAVSGRLTSLRMGTLTGLGPGDLSPVRRDCDDNPSISATEERLAFPHLRDLEVRFSSEAVYSDISERELEYFSGVQELEDLLFDCPQLECLSMDVPRRAELGGLAAILRDRSPLIRSVEIWGDDTGGEEQLAHFIGHAFTNGLVYLKVDTTGLTIELAAAIATHCPTLESLRITATRQMDDNGILELLVRGQRLTDISLRCTAKTDITDTVSVLSSQPWGCKDVETLDLGLMIAFEGKAIKRVLKQMAETDPIMKEWTLEYSHHVRHQHVFGTRGMLRGYLRMIRGLSKLREVHFGGATFRRCP
ncbi:MAG: hypothetical protein JOS17DRAFT_775517 [Linnemannia elongata]|nr:MAG: hypothetical protein JOS17DRAFT_775517 [Linnemannia elongata]